MTNSLTIYTKVHEYYTAVYGYRYPGILFLALIILLLFGGKKIPELMKGIGKGVKKFQGRHERSGR